jgi:hypothetical protein
VSVSPERALATAVFAALAADSGVRAALGDPPRLYDAPPPDAAFPYAVLAAIETTDASAGQAPALAHVLTLHIWSRYAGRAEVLDALHVVRAALDDRPLSIFGRRLVVMSVLASEVLRAGDGLTVQGVLRLRAITEPN